MCIVNEGFVLSSATLWDGVNSCLQLMKTPSTLPSTFLKIIFVHMLHTSDGLNTLDKCSTTAIYA